MNRSGAVAGVVAAALMLLAAACSHPLSEESFMRADQALALPGGRLLFGFSLDFSDSALRSYDISLFAKSDAPFMAAESRSPMPLSIRWKYGKDSVALSETVYLPMGGRQAGALYRSGVVPRERGIWTLEIVPQDPPQGLRGIGVVCKGNR